MAMLHSFDIRMLVDVRHFPGSRKYPQFNQDALRQALAAEGIGYEHIISLGGRRKARPDTRNTAWRHPAFRGYADHMETPVFQEGINRLEVLGREGPLAYMCSEAVWWRCHRSMISDYLKAEGWQVLHIMEVGKAREHPFTAPARLVDGHLSYSS
jgi:uncharacterized protein (DUF488 family)